MADAPQLAFFFFVGLDFFYSKLSLSSRTDRNLPVIIGIDASGKGGERRDRRVS